MSASSMSAKGEADWMKILARTGYAAKGVVYLIVGGLAAQGIASQGSEGALSKIAQQPFGKVLLGIVAVGLLAYAAWRIVQSIADPENEGDDPTDIAKRVGYFASGVVYLGLAVSAARIIFGGGGGGGTQSLTAQVLSFSFGQWLVGGVGVAIILGGLHQLKEAVTAGFKEDFALGEMSSTEETWATRAGRIGHAARTVVYFIIGWFLIRAAMTRDASEAGGLGKALDALQNQPYGPWLLGATGVGLVAYGVYCFVMARYRKAVM